MFFFIIFFFLSFFFSSQVSGSREFIAEDEFEESDLSDFEVI